MKRVKMPSERYFGRFAHIFFEPKIANRLFNTIHNCINKEFEVPNQYTEMQITELEQSIYELKKNRLIAKISADPYNVKQFSNYEFYKNEISELAEIRDKKLGIGKSITKIFVGYDWITNELNDLDFKIKSFYQAKQRLDECKAKLEGKTYSSEFLSLSEIQDLVLNSKLLKRIEKESNLKDSRTLKGSSRVALLLDYVLYKKGKLKFYLDSDDGDQSDYATERGGIYGLSGNTILRKKNELKADDSKGSLKRALESLLNDKIQLANVIVFVAKNIDTLPSEEFNKELLAELMKRWLELDEK